MTENPSRARHSVLGIASFAISLAAGVLLISLLALTWPAITGRDEVIDRQFLASLLFSGWSLVLIALTLGVVGLFAKGRRRLFSILGSVLAGIPALILGASFLVPTTDESDWDRSRWDLPDALHYVARWTDAGWVFEHPDARGEVLGEMFVPVDQPVQLEFDSAEGREFSIPDFGFKRELGTREFPFFWFKATALGSYEILHRRSGIGAEFELAGYVHVVE